MNDTGTSKLSPSGYVAKGVFGPSVEFFGVVSKADVIFFGMLGVVVFYFLYCGSPSELRIIKCVVERCVLMKPYIILYNYMACFENTVHPGNSNSKGKRKTVGVSGGSSYRVN